MIDWNKGFSSLFELRRVDPVSWNDTDILDFTEGSVDRSEDGLIESADLTMTQNPGECWVRVYVKAKQGSSGAREAVFTGLTSTPKRDLDGRRVSYHVECYSALKPAADTLTPRGFYVPAGENGVLAAAELLGVGAAPVMVEDAPNPRLLTSIVSQDSDTNLDMAYTILDAIGWRIVINGDGRILLTTRASEVSAVFDEQENDSIELSITDTNDWYSAPNCIRVVSGNLCVEVKDNNPNNPMSVTSRKASRGGTGEIWMSDSSPSVGDGESLEEYAMRVLANAQAPARTISYDRRFRPGVSIGDLVQLHLPSVSIDGIYRITSQKIELHHGLRTSEEVVLVG